MKPVKNNRRIDPRYFLDETINRSKQRIDEKVGAHMASSEGGVNVPGAEGSSDRTTVSFNSKEDEARFKAFEEALKYMGYKPDAIKHGTRSVDEFSIHKVSARASKAALAAWYRDMERARSTGGRPEEVENEHEYEAASTIEHHYEVDPATHELVAQNLMQAGFRPGPDGKISSPERYISIYTHQGEDHESKERQHFLKGVAQQQSAQERQRRRRREKREGPLDTPATPLQESKKRKRKVAKQKKSFDQLLQEELDRVDNVLYERKVSLQLDSKIASRLSVENVQVLESMPPMYVFKATFEFRVDDALGDLVLEWTSPNNSFIKGGGQGSGYGDRENSKVEAIADSVSAGSSGKASIVFYSPKRNGHLSVALKANGPVRGLSERVLRTQADGVYIHHVNYPDPGVSEKQNSGAKPLGQGGGSADTRPTSGDYRTRPYLKCMPNGKCVRMVARK
jgi:hypothetical protein